MINTEPKFTLNISISKKFFGKFPKFNTINEMSVIVFLLTLVSGIAFIYFYNNGLGLAYNDARSHLDIGRRVVEGLKPGIAQLGSVWLPLPHLLMVPTIWNDFMWHSGLAGSLASMASFIFTGLIISLYLKELNVGVLGRLAAVLIFAVNLNILYLQSTAMTELLILFTMTAGSYELLLWHKNNKIVSLVKAGFWIMLSTLTRYDGWFLLAIAATLVTVHVLTREGKLNGIFKTIKKKYQETEGTLILFLTLSSFGIFLWLAWNQLIFNDPLYFAFGPYSARAQQIDLEAAGNLPTKGDVWLSAKMYFYALMYNSGGLTVVLGTIGAIFLWLDKKISRPVKLATIALIAPLFFNILALYLGHSVLFIQGLSGNTWFNVRYGVMLLPAFAIFIGFLLDRFPSQKTVIIGLLAFVTFFSIVSFDTVTIDDAKVGSSQKNVTEVSSWLANNAGRKDGYILISAASHDAIIFSSGLPMKRFIHEGTGLYWESAIATPDRWARWIIMRTHDENDSTFRLIKDTKGFARYNLVDHFPFADIYELKPEYLNQLNTKPAFERQK
jgi:hypothetical protein